MNESGHIISIEGAHLMIYEVRESVDELFGKLSNIELSEYANLKSDKRRLEYLGVRLALKNLLGEEKKIIYTSEGKPELSDKSYHISVSHSDSWIAVMAHSTKKVGIDIEKPTDKISKIYQRFLNDTEQKELSGGKNLNKLLLAWSGKEALYKIIGIDAVDFANHLHIFPFEVKSEGTIEAQHIPTKDYYKLQYIQNEAYTLVYCIAEK
ncbi:MAG: 4'-phosphopantetheinyl transferase superfamily protein [Paludibacter sp.]